MGGPFSLKDDTRRLECIHSAGSKYMHAILEHPRVMNRSYLSDNEHKKYINLISNQYDIIMPITTYLVKYYQNHGRVKPSLLNPIVVDVNNASCFKKRENKQVRKLIYTGNLNHDEEMQLLLTSFASVLKEVPDCLLEVIGGSSKKQTASLLTKHKHACTGLGIGKAVRFLGMMPHAEVMKRYCTADAFLLPRPFRLYSRAGFPTKLGEYLITGNPVITTATGDIPLYLEDGVSAYLVNDSSSDSFAERVVQCIIDSNSSEVGERGRQVAQESFSIEASARRIKSFFQENNYYE